MEVLLTIVVCVTTWAFQCNQPLSIFKAYLDLPRLQNFDPQTKKNKSFSFWMKRVVTNTKRFFSWGPTPGIVALKGFKIIDWQQNETN